MNFLIGVFFGSVLTFLAVKFITRKVFQRQTLIVQAYELRIETLLTRIDGLMFSIHHEYSIPRLKRLRGSVNVLKLTFKKLKELRDTLEKASDFAERPNHYKYTRLVVETGREMVKEFNSIAPLFEAIYTEAEAIEKEIMENTQKYNDYRK